MRSTIWDAEKDWAATLSPGEIRLLSFARLILAQPAFAFLDVGVSGLDDFWVNTLYRALSRTKTVYVSIGENESLRVYHDVELILAERGISCQCPSAYCAISHRDIEAVISPFLPNETSFPSTSKEASLRVKTGQSGTVD